MNEIQISEVAHELGIPEGERRLTAAGFKGLAEVPSELEWFANIDNKSPRAYENALQDFSASPASGSQAKSGS